MTTAQKIGPREIPKFRGKFLLQITGCLPAPATPRRCTMADHHRPRPLEPGTSLRRLDLGVRATALPSPLERGNAERADSHNKDHARSGALLESSNLGPKLQTRRKR